MSRQPIRLDELDTVGAVAQLSTDEARALVATDLVEARPESPGSWRLLPNGRVGAVRVGDVQVEVRPKEKVGLAHLLFLLGYATDQGFRPELVPTEEELHQVRFEFDPAPALETLMLHFCGEIRLNHWYRRAAEWHTEPVIKQIYETLAKDEARHGGAYLRYMKRALNRFGDEARAAFTKVGVLMASARRTAQALHPTNLHVNEALFPRDTIQSRLPDPAWLEHWLDKQIQFDSVWENKVVERILHNMSLLMERSFASVQELNRFRKEVTASVAAAAKPVSGATPA